MSLLLTQQASKQAASRGMLAALSPLVKPVWEMQLVFTRERLLLWILPCVMLDRCGGIVVLCPMCSSTGAGREGRGGHFNNNRCRRDDSDFLKSRLDLKPLEPRKPSVNLLSPSHAHSPDDHATPTRLHPQQRTLFTRLRHLLVSRLPYINTITSETVAASFKQADLADLET